MDYSLDYAKSLDDADALKKFRSRFRIPERDGRQQIYFLGNSLGLQPVSTASYINRVLDEWAKFGVEGFFEGDEPWMSMHDRIANPMANIVGALPAEIVVMNSLTVNLHLLMASFYQPTAKRFKILCEAKAFPSDQYMLESLCRYLRMDPNDVLIEVHPAAGQTTISNRQITDAITHHANELALVFIGGVNYYTGQLFDLKEITRVAREHDVKVGFDLAHAAGNVPLQLHEWDTDFACWCNYKYLNAGPGAVAAAFIHERYHCDSNINRLAGWWGYDKATRFKMQKGFVAVPTAEGWSVSTPPILLFAALQASLDIFEEAGFDAILKKGADMSGYLLALLENLNERLPGSQIEILTPYAATEHGCQISMLMHRQGRQVFEALSAKGIFADWREPNVIRVAPVPLYNSFVEIHQFVGVMQDVLRQAN